MFGKKRDEPDWSMSLPTGRQDSKPLDMSGWLFARTLIPSDNMARDVRVVGEFAWPLLGTRRYPEPASLEERIKALEKQGE